MAAPAPITRLSRSCFEIFYASAILFLLLVAGIFVFQAWNQAQNFREINPFSNQGKSANLTLPLLSTACLPLGLAVIAMLLWGIKRRLPQKGDA
jgi:hypothetical protein